MPSRSTHPIGMDVLLHPLPSVSAKPSWNGRRPHRCDHDVDVFLGRIDKRQRWDARRAQDAYPHRGGHISTH
jgi:hypothetical protein